MYALNIADEDIFNSLNIVYNLKNEIAWVPKNFYWQDFLFYGLRSITEEKIFQYHNKMSALLQCKDIINATVIK